MYKIVMWMPDYGMLLVVLVSSVTAYQIAKLGYNKLLDFASTPLKQCFLSFLPIVLFLLDFAGTFVLIIEKYGTQAPLTRTGEVKLYGLVYVLCIGPLYFVVRYIRKALRGEKTGRM